MAIEGQQPEQRQSYPGSTDEMSPEPHDEMRGYGGRGLLDGRKALITGGDSGIGRATAIAFAKEGADVAIVYLEEHDDAAKTKRLVEQEGVRCVALAGDVGDEAFCRKAIDETVKAFGHLDIVVNNAGEQHPQESLEDITSA